MTVIDFGKQPEEEKSTAVKLLSAVGLVAAIVFGGALGWVVIGFLSATTSLAVAALIGLGLVRVLAAPLLPLNFVKKVIILVAGAFLTMVAIGLGTFTYNVLWLIFKEDIAVGESIYYALLDIVGIITVGPAP